ncbi:hypothetical protein EK21DRAFT_64168 [Setomelanomma holmii]|uniref:Ubiquitin carboxyl-terminal hydrolase 14 n=1 Tax=Setomelanomma holmii TaxID=210430 RepID=A0A9P4LPR1_9PLEO|nr:hypothetical protein EK21DRAFT_64168 [Setomelanomma holmii]
MGTEARKRYHASVQGAEPDEAPAKRRRQNNEEQLKMSKLYDDLAAEADDTRLEAAKQLIIKFSPESKPAAKDVENALSRLINGLCSQRKAARIGFSLTLTELLRQLFGQKENAIEGFDLNVASLIKSVEEKTKVEGNVPGRERRDHLIGRLFGYKALLQSSIVIEPELSMECWNQLLDHIYGMARDVPWLREECGMVLVEAAKSLQGQAKHQACAKAMIGRLGDVKLVSTPEGVAIWLTVKADYEDVLPEGVWHGKDPLSRKDRSRLAKILKENYQGRSENGDSENIKTAAASPNPTFAWNLVIGEILQRDAHDKSARKDATKADFHGFWLDVVDNNLFTSTSSHERKAWGFKLLSSMFHEVPDQSVFTLLSPNLMRTLINQSKKDDRFLHSAALAALTSIQARVQREPTSALPIFVALTSKNGSIEFDKITRTKTLEHILLSANNDTLKKIVRHLNTLILRPETEDEVVAHNRRQVIADLVLNLIKHFKRYDELANEAVEQDSWLGKSLEILVEHAYFVPSEGAKTSKVPLPPLSEKSRQTFQERLSSCLTKLLAVDVGSRSTFALMVVGMIRSKSTSSKSLTLAFKADRSVSETLEKASQTLDAISAKGSIAGNKLAAEGFILLYSLTILQVYNGEGDAVMMLDDLDVSRKAMLKKAKESTDEGSDVFVEIVLSFLGNQRTLFRKIGEEALSIFASEISAAGLSSLTDILDTEENLDGQKELFNQADDDDQEGESSQSSDDSDVDSDVAMVDGEGDSDGDSAFESESDSDSSTSDDDESEDDAELTQFNNLLAMTLQTSKPGADGEDDDETSDESDMDDEQMMALDPHLSKIFLQRSKTTSKKKEREDAKHNVVHFKGRVLDLLAIYLEKQYSNPLTLQVLLPIVRRTRASANKQLAEKASKLLKTHFDSRTKHKAPLPRPDDAEGAWAIFKEVHEEAKLGGGAKIHADACSSTSLHFVKVLVGMDRENYAGVADVYAETQKQWFKEKKSQLQPSLFTTFTNWSLNARQQGNTCSQCLFGKAISVCRSLSAICPTKAMLPSVITGASKPSIKSHRSLFPLFSPTFLKTTAFPEAAMACTHVNAPGTCPASPPNVSPPSNMSTELRAPGPTQSVYREDCTQCFDSIDDPTGLDVCLYCFNGGCTSDRNHSLLHVSSTNHPLVLNIKRTRKHIRRDEPPQKVTKLAIAAETESDRYDTTTQVKCYECGVDDVDHTSGKLSELVDAVLKASTFARQEEVKAWEQELTACEHTLCLEQETARQTESQSLGHCSECELNENLWLCLSCGNLGCGRQQFGGIGGNSHGVGHTKTTGHPVAVKLGSLTADGTADIYCYACDEERIDPELPNHLAHWGINIKDRVKTEKSLTEMQVEQNLRWDFAMVTEDGKELQPLFGPDLTGLKNLGNSCYLNSTLQALFAMPEFKDRYYLPEEESPSTQRPAEDLEIQLRKVADGLISGRYSKPDSNVSVSEHSPEAPHQRGLAPAMLKHLIGRGHVEFSTMRQQDAFELLLHLLKLISRSQHVAPHKDPVDAFRFAMEQRLQCISCKRVRYRTDEQENISIPVPIRRIPKEARMEVTDDSGKDKAQEKEEFESVSLKECLDIFTAEEMVELTCGACGSKDGFTKRSLFKTFPSVLAVNARRFELVNWVPTKQDVPVIVNDEAFSFDAYKSHGLADGEELLPENADAGSSSSKWVPNEAALSMLEAMGFPRVRCEKALHATGNEDPEAASNWLFSHMEDPDIDDPADFNPGSGGNTASTAIDSEKVENLGAMGFSAPQARQALKETGGDMERAVDWLFSHPNAQGDFGEGSDSEAPATQREKTFPGSEELPANFQLQSIVCHKGSSIHAGHYVAFVRKQLPNEQTASWVLFNDEKVAKAVDVEEMKKFAYVYFFRRL